MSKGLNPCPICGKTLDLIRCFGESIDSFWARCRRCKLEGPARDTVEDAFKAFDSLKGARRWRV